MANYTATSNTTREQILFQNYKKYFQFFLKLQ